jgi:methyltransferase family protein
MSELSISPSRSAGPLGAKGAVPSVRSLAAERGFLSYINDIRKFHSVVEFGCGLANWLRVARELGAIEIRGYDIGDIPVAARGLTAAEFCAIDLGSFIRTEKTYDLAICIEVAQTLAPAAGTSLVKTLCAAADWVLFSAAPPFQGGLDHVNENWMEKWAGLFSERGFLCYDILREKFWNDRDIPFYCRQNACLYVRRGIHTALTERRLMPTDRPPTLIHPELYLKLTNWLANNRNGATDGSNFEAEVGEYYRAVQILKFANPKLKAASVGITR